MNSVKAISLAVVLGVSLAAAAQRGGHGGGGGRNSDSKASPGHGSLVQPAVGRVTYKSVGGGAGNARGFKSGYAPSHLVNDPYAGGWGMHYENWSGNNFKGSFNFNGKHDAMQQGLDRDKNHYGESHVGHMVGNGFGQWGDHLRYGYVGWPSWRDGDFYFNNWIFSPYGDPCAISPFYSYPWLPPYISERNIVFRPGTNFDFGIGAPYQYRLGFDNYGYGNPALNCSIAQICAIYGTNPVDAVGYVIPGDQPVGVYSGGKYMYSLNGPDFSKIVIDTARSSFTIGFGINFVRQIGDNAVVNCTQTCRLPEGGQASFEQNYELCKMKDKYVVTGFMSSPKS